MVPKKEHNPKSNQRKPKAFSKGRHRAPDGKSPTHKTKGQKGGQKSSKSKQHKTKDKDRAQNSPKQQLKQDGNAKKQTGKGQSQEKNTAKKAERSFIEPLWRDDEAQAQKSPRTPRYSGPIPKETPELPDSGGPSPYTKSPLRYITGQRRFPTTVETLYKKYLHLLANPENFTITCYYPRLQEALWVEGINIESGRTPRYKLKQGDLGKIPMVIPRLRGISMAMIPFLRLLPKNSWFCLEINEFFGLRKVNAEAEWAQNLRAAFPEGSRIILTNISNPRWNLTYLWPQRHDLFYHSFFDQFREAGDIFMVPEIGMCIDDDTAQAMVHLHLQEEIAALAADAGLVPMIALDWREAHDCALVADWLRSLWPDVKAFAVYLTIASEEGLRGPDRIAWIQSLLDVIDKYLSSVPFHWILSGSIHQQAIKLYRRYFPNGNYSILTSKPYEATLRGSFITSRDRAQTFRREIAQIEMAMKGVPGILPPGEIQLLRAPWAYFMRGKAMSTFWWPVDEEAVLFYAQQEKALRGDEEEVLQEALRARSGEDSEEEGSAEDLSLDYMEPLAAGAESNLQPEPSGVDALVQDLAPTED